MQGAPPLAVCVSTTRRAPRKREVPRVCGSPRDNPRLVHVHVTRRDWGAQEAGVGADPGSQREGSETGSEIKLPLSPPPPQRLLAFARGGKSQRPHMRWRGKTPGVPGARAPCEAVPLLPPSPPGTAFGATDIVGGGLPHEWRAAQGWDHAIFTLPQAWHTVGPHEALCPAWAVGALCTCVPATWTTVPSLGASVWDAGGKDGGPRQSLRADPRATFLCPAPLLEPRVLGQ